MFSTSGNYQKKYFTQIKMILTRFHEGTSQIKINLTSKETYNIIKHYKLKYLRSACLKNNMEWKSKTNSNILINIS